MYTGTDYSRNRYTERNRFPHKYLYCVRLRNLYELTKLKEELENTRWYSPSLQSISEEITPGVYLWVPRLVGYLLRTWVGCRTSGRVNWTTDFVLTGRLGSNLVDLVKSDLYLYQCSRTTTYGDSKPNQTIRRNNIVID